MQKKHTKGLRSARMYLPASQNKRLFCLSLGYTLVELMVVVAIIGSLLGIATPTFTTYLNKARIARAIQEIRLIEKDIAARLVWSGRLPATLQDVGHGGMLDPWGNLYQYLNVATVTGKGKLRKDRFLVPLNSDYDLYSMGRDGQSKAPLTAKASRDDIIRANNGGYVGLACLF